MHPNPAFRGVEAARNLDFAREAGFGALTLAGADGPLVSHIPFMLNEAGDRLSAHIVRSNPIWRVLRDGPAQAVMAIVGPHGYISPDWYGIDDQVPTWNYVAVHLRGALSLISEEDLRPHLDAVSKRFEAELAPKPVWRTDKMDAEALSRMMRMIAPIEMVVEAVDGTWKLNQNKDEAARLGAADAVEARGNGALAALMRNPPD